MRDRSALSAVLCLSCALVACGSKERPSGVLPEIPLPPWQVNDTVATPPPLTPPAPGVGRFSAALGETVTADRAPPPLTGGTLLVLPNGLAVAADPDRDRVWVADLAAVTAYPAIALRADDEPGRLCVDDRGNVHVALRRGGAVVTIDPVRREILQRRPVCSAPRGIAYDPARAELVVACAGGELVSLPRDGGDGRTVTLDPDLRDVVLWQGRRFVTRFRSAQLVEVSPEGRVLSIATPPSLLAPERGTARIVPEVAWRTFADPVLGIVMLHQSVLSAPLTTVPGGYGAPGGTCSVGAVQSMITRFDGTTSVALTAMLAGATLAIDAAAVRGGIAVSASGNTFLGVQVPIYDPTVRASAAGLNCLNALPLRTPSGRQVIAVAADPAGRTVFQIREPAGLNVNGGITIAFPAASSVADTGHTIFHANAGGGLACASCHPEGGDDGHTWSFEAVGARRTPSVRGARSSTAPFHWDGDQTDMTHLLNDVFAQRMSGGALTASQIASMAHWVDGLSGFPNPPTLDPSGVARGRALFESEAIGCAGCHGGADLTNNETMDVGTGGAFQVPSLRGVVWRAPYLHDGRAPTLRSRLMMDNSDQHGHVSRLSNADREDLTRYLETL